MVCHRGSCQACPLLDSLLFSFWSLLICPFHRESTPDMLSLKASSPIYLLQPLFCYIFSQFLLSLLELQYICIFVVCLLALECKLHEGSPFIFCTHFGLPVLQTLNSIFLLNIQIKIISYLEFFLGKGTGLQLYTFQKGFGTDPWSRGFFLSSLN